MPFEPDFVNDGDAANALSVNATFNDAKAWIDALDVGSSRRGAFNHRHAAGLIREQGAPLTAQWVPAVGSKVYSRAIFGASIQYASWNNNLATAETATIGAGDRVMIGHEDAGGAGTDVPARLTFTGVRLGPARDNVGCILVLANVHVESVFVGNGVDMEVMVCIQFQIDGGALWQTLETSERFLSHSDHTLSQTGEHTFFDIPIAALITEADVDEVFDPAVNKVTGVRLCLSLVGSGTTSLVTIERWNMSVLPLFCEMG